MKFCLLGPNIKEKIFFSSIKILSRKLRKALQPRQFEAAGGGFHVTSSSPCWWTKTKDLSLAPFVCPPAIVHCSIVICVSIDWLQTLYFPVTISKKRGCLFTELGFRVGFSNGQCKM